MKKRKWTDYDPVLVNDTEYYLDVIKKLDKKFFNENEWWVKAYYGKYSYWVQKCYRKNKEPLMAAQIIQRAKSIYKR